jgi:hypothetical protein
MTGDTDDAGHFEFNELIAGRYILGAEKPGYVPVYYGQRQAFEPVRVLEISISEARDDIGLTLPKGGVISGRILDEYGDPVADALVNALLKHDEETPEPQDGDAGRLLLAQEGAFVVPAAENRTVRTDDLGRFRLYGLACADYYITAVIEQSGNSRASGDASLRYVPTYFPGTTRIDDAQLVRAAPEREVVANFAIAPTRLLKVSGWVSQSDGKRATEGFVRVLARRSKRSSTLVQTGLTRLRSDGSFMTWVMPNGKYMLYASAGSPWARRGVQKDVEVGQTSIGVRTDAISGLSLTTAPGGVISGKVMGSPGSVRPDVESMRIVPIAADRESVPGVLGSAPVDADGGFELHNVFGRTLLSIAAPGGGTRLGAVYLGSQDVTDIGVHIAARERLDNVRVVLVNAKTTVSGKVTNEAGEPAANAIVLFFASAEIKWHNNQLNRYTRLTRTDETGFYIVHSLVPGDYFGIALEHIQTESITNSAILTNLRSAATSFRSTDGIQKSLNLRLSTAPAEVMR